MVIYFPGRNRGLPYRARIVLSVLPLGLHMDDHSHHSVQYSYRFDFTSQFPQAHTDQSVLPYGLHADDRSNHSGLALFRDRVFLAMFSGERGACPNERKLICPCYLTACTRTTAVATQLSTRIIWSISLFLERI